MDRRKEKLSLTYLIAYASVQFGIQSSELILSGYLTLFLLDYAKVTPSLVGVITGASELMDIFASLFIGQLSDNTKSSMGPRRPWILTGSIILPIFIFLLFIILPSTLPSGLIFTYYLVINVLIAVFYSVIILPHQAYGPELSKDFNERLRISNYNSIGAFLGMLGLSTYGLLVFNGILPLVPEEYVSWIFLILAAFPCLAVLISGIVCFCVVTISDPEEYDFEFEDEDEPACANVTALFKVAPFVIAILIFTLGGIIQFFPFTLFAVFVVHVLKLNLDVFTIAQIIMMASTVLVIIILNKVGKFFEKRTVLCFGCVVGCLCFIGTYFIPADGSVLAKMLVYLISAFTGITLGIIFTIPNSMIADVTDLTLLKYHKKQEGLIYSIAEICQSVLMASASYLTTFILAAAGYENDGDQPQEVQDLLRFMYCAVPTIILIIIWLLCLGYSLNKEKHRWVLKELTKSLKKDEIDLFGGKKMLTVSRVAGKNFVNRLQFVESSDKEVFDNARQYLVRRETTQLKVIKESGYYRERPVVRSKSVMGFNLTTVNKELDLN